MLLACFALGAGVALGGGCAEPQAPWSEGLWTRRPPDYPFLPARVLVHPLTRASQTREGAWRLRIHFFFVDAWGDQVKGLGRASVQLFADGRVLGRPIDVVQWDAINLSDLSTNRAHYDHVTRTYVLEVPQEAMPDWLPQALAELAGKESDPDEAYRSFAGRLTIRVEYSMPMSDGETVRTSNDFVLAPG